MNDCRSSSPHGNLIFSFRGQRSFKSNNKWIESLLLLSLVQPLICGREETLQWDLGILLVVSQMHLHLHTSKIHPWQSTIKEERGVLNHNYEANKPPFLFLQITGGGGGGDWSWCVPVAAEWRQEWLLIRGEPAQRMGIGLLFTRSFPVPVLIICQLTHPKKINAQELLLNKMGLTLVDWTFRLNSLILEQSYV